MQPTSLKCCGSARLHARLAGLPGLRWTLAQHLELQGQGAWDAQELWLQQGVRAEGCWLPQLLNSKENTRLAEGELQKDSAADVPLACAAHLPVLMELCGLSPALSMAFGHACPHRCLLPGLWDGGGPWLSLSSRLTQQKTSPG